MMTGIEISYEVNIYNAYLQTKEVFNSVESLYKPIPSINYSQCANKRFIIVFYPQGLHDLCQDFEKFQKSDTDE